MITPVWGDTYIERWLSLCVASLRSEDNLSCLVHHFDFEWAIVTREADIDRMRRNPRFTGALAGINVKFLPLDDLMPRTGGTNYGVPLTLAYAKAIQDLGADAVGSYVIVMNADFVVTPGAMRSVADRILAGYDSVSVASLRTDDDEMRPLLLEHLDGRDGKLAIPSRAMMRLALPHLHTHVTGRIVNEPGSIEAWYYHQIFWRISDDCLAMRGLLLHPFCFRIARPLEAVCCPIDYGFVSELCPGGRSCVLSDSDEFLMIELQQRHSESELLRIAPPYRNPRTRMASLVQGIARHAATWATAEHRRNLETTVYYHAGALPEDTARRVAPFERFTAEIARRMPPPRAHASHWHWLLAVRCYRADMARGGNLAQVPLLRDPRNEVEPVVPPFPDPRVAADDASPVGSACGPINERTREAHRRRIGAMIEAELRRGRPRGSLDPDMLYIGDMELHSPMPRSRSRTLRYGNPSGPDNRRDFHVVMPEQLLDGSANDVLLICAGIGFLPLWENLAQDLAAFLALRRRVILAFIREGFAPLSFARHTLLFSLLTRALPARSLDARLTIYDPAALAGTAGWLGSRLRAITSRIFPRWASQSAFHTGATPQSGSFSALILTVEARREPCFQPRLARLRPQLRTFSTALGRLHPKGTF